MELSKSGQTSQFQTQINPQIQPADNQFSHFTPTNWALLQNRPNIIPNPNLPIRPFSGSRILMPWEHASVQIPNSQNTPAQKSPKLANAQNTPALKSPKFSKQNPNKRPIQQIDSSQKPQNNQNNAQIESIRSKLRESLSNALSIGEKSTSTGDESNDSNIIVDELLQGNGLSWATESNLHKTPQKLENSKTLAFKIESELYNLFGGVNKKYKEKGRSLLFNLKDPSNPDLRIRVVNYEITPEKLCNMSAEELASKELSEWRQAKAHEMAQAIVLPDDTGLDMRKRVKKTHKGEFVILEDEKDTNFPLESEIKAGSLTTPKPVKAQPIIKAQPDKAQPDKDEDLMLELMVDGFNEDLMPVVTLDEFMKDLDSEPPFEDIVGEKVGGGEVGDKVGDKVGEKIDAINDAKVGENDCEKIIDKVGEKSGEKSEGNSEGKKGLEVSSGRDGLEVSSEEENGEVVWEGVLQMNLSALASVAAFYKSGEKPVMNEWPGFIEIKGRVKLNDFEKFLKVLPQSKSRAIMLTQIKWKEGSMESGRQNLLETIESYISDSRVGISEPGPGVELYLCPSNEKMLDLFTKLLPKDLAQNLHVSQNTLVGLIVWRRPVLNTQINHNKNNNKKKKEMLQVVEKRNDNNNNDDDDDVPPGFGHMVNNNNNNHNHSYKNNNNDDDLPEFDFSKNVNFIKPVTQIRRDLINKYGHSGNVSEANKWKNNNINDDDDIPEWNPNQDQRKPGFQIPIHEQQNLMHRNNNNQFIAPPAQQILQPPLIQPNFRANNNQIGNINMPPNYQNYYQVNNNQYNYRLPNLGNQNPSWRGA